ncbi:U3 small nucleolar RNA-associated protein 18 homolog [Gouania willdenowi]|uniref:U3 small nucleolar RNA-associated protein 18 homolog n=1 Tax=Gouania willdenowi TaxID=441366 RepID=A0A8C5EET4_GOUWI|nr:U3 small nucleolar RNA-associated protein 18 homolog [Gouania willdenowi]
MANSGVIRLPEDEPRAPVRKRARPRGSEPGQEEARRAGNVQQMEALREEDHSVRLLEELLFGAEEQLLGRLQENAEKTSASLLLDDDDDDDEEGDDSKVRPSVSKGPVWFDEDDEKDEEVDMSHRYRRNLIKGDAESKMPKMDLQRRMTEHFQKTMGGKPSWAEPSSQRKKRKGDEYDEDDLMKRTGNFVAPSERLPAGILQVKRCCPSNASRPSVDRLSSIQFHPSAQVVMTAGLDQSISLFQVDGKSNPQIQNVVLERFPVFKARFSHDGHAVIATSLRNKLFYVYDMMAGRVMPVPAIRGLNEAHVKEFSVCPEGGAMLLSGTNGYLHLLTLKTQEVIGSMKMNANVSSVAITSDSSKVFAHSDEGEVYVWDVRSSRCMNRFSDEGCLVGTSISASPDGRYLACGSQSGVVNIYSQEACLNSTNPKPVKAVMNLLTSATSLTFNPSSEVLAMASHCEDEAVRLLHVSTLSVFSNFPLSKKKFVYRASCLDFSPHSGFFSLTNNKGHAPLIRLLHYKDF